MSYLPLVDACTSMSQSAPATAAITPETDETTTVDDADAVQDLLDVLQDPACRDILDVTSEDALSANEISEACDLPLSTTYRKLDLLTDADLLGERTRIRRSGKHTSEYGRLVEDVVVSVDGDGATELAVTRRELAGPATVV